MLCVCVCTYPGGITMNNLEEVITIMYHPSLYYIYTDTPIIDRKCMGPTDHHSAPFTLSWPSNL